MCLFTSWKVLHMIYITKVFLFLHVYNYNPVKMAYHSDFFLLQQYFVNSHKEWSNFQYNLQLNDNFMGVCICTVHNSWERKRNKGIFYILIKKYCNVTPRRPPHSHIILLTISLLYGRWSTSGFDRGNAHFLPLQEYDQGGRRK